MTPLYEGVLAGVVGAVGEPEGEDLRAQLASYLDALDKVVGSPAAHGFVRVADASEPVVFLLEEVRVYRPRSSYSESPRTALAPRSHRPYPMGCG